MRSGSARRRFYPERELFGYTWGTPGAFGARASRLYQILQAGHYDVRLPPEAMHRLTVWLDSGSPFYGVYEEKGQQAQLRGEVVRPTLE